MDYECRVIDKPKQPNEKNYLLCMLGERLWNGLKETAAIAERYKQWSKVMLPVQPQ